MKQTVLHFGDKRGVYSSKSLNRYHVAIYLHRFNYENAQYTHGFITMYLTSSCCLNLGSTLFICLEAYIIFLASSDFFSSAAKLCQQFGPSPGLTEGWSLSGSKPFDNLTLKPPIMTAADDKFGNNFPNFQKK